MLTMMFFAHRATYHIAFIMLFALLGASNIYAAWQPALNEHDIDLLSAQAKRAYLNTQRIVSKSSANDTLGTEVLLVELQEKKSRTSIDPQLAEVFIFDYPTNSAIVQLINVDTHELVSTRHITHIHLPLNQHEQDVTNKILLGDTALINELENEYLAQFGQPLSSIEQLDMKISIWEPGPNDTQASFCDRTRCALVSIFTHDFYNFSIEPVVELQNAKVYLDLIQ